MIKTMVDLLLSQLDISIQEKNLAECIAKIKSGWRHEITKNESEKKFTVILSRIVNYTDKQEKTFTFDVWIYENFIKAVKIL